MKKAMKKLMAALLAVAMVCAMAIPAFAAGGAAAGTTYTITALDNGHTYEIYQIFTGTPTTDATTHQTILSDIKWGKNAASPYNKGDAVPEAVLTALAAVSGTNETDILTEVKKYVDLTGTSAFTAKYGQSASVPAGYYLIKDEDNADVDSHTLYLVEVIDHNITITPKTDAPSVEKKVQENTKYPTDGGYDTGYNDTADYHIGDMVPFKLIGRIPDMSRYTTYNYVFHDTLSKAFDAPDKSAIKVSLSDSKATLGTDIDSALYTVDVTTDAAGETTIKVSFNNLKSVHDVAKDKYIVVSYSAKLNANASIGRGTPGNTNEVYLEYSNNPNNGGIGKTPEDKVIVFTYELDVTKVDGKDSNKKLPDAKFKLLDSTKTYFAKVDTTTNKFTGWTSNEADATELVSDANGLFKVIGLDDGTYFLKETLAPSGYNTLAEPIELAISADTSNGQYGSGAVTELKTINVTVGSDPAVSGNAAAGTVGIEVKNNQGTTLPGTGGIGTTIFYVVGGGLMVAAGVLLITKKRMENR